MNDPPGIQTMPSFEALSAAVIAGLLLPDEYLGGRLLAQCARLSAIACSEAVLAWQLNSRSTRKEYAASVLVIGYAI